jgi:hypothetical protein
VPIASASGKEDLGSNPDGYEFFCGKHSNAVVPNLLEMHFWGEIVNGLKWPKNVFFKERLENGI